MKKKILAIVLVIIILIGAYFGYKAYSLYEYRMDNEVIPNYDSLISNININEKVTKTNQKLEDNEYLKFENLKIQNKFPGFEISSTDKEYVKYNIRNEYNIVIAEFWMGTEDSYMSRLNGKDMQDFYKSHNIKNDLDMIKYVSDNKNNKSTVLTSLNDIKCRYALTTHILNVLPESEKIVEITGDNTGYILYGKDTLTEIVLLKDNKRYIFTFISKTFFNEQFINEILNTITID